MRDDDTIDLYRWIMRSTTDGLWIFDDAGRTTFANDRLAEILGRTPEEMVDLPVGDVLDATGKRQFLAYLEELTRSESGTDNLESSLIRRDGSRIWALVSHSPLLDDDGTRRGWLHRVTELTDRRLLIGQLVSSEQKLAEAQSIAKVGSWEWDIPNDVVTWSDELYRIFELQPQEFEATYEGFLSYIHAEDRPEVEAAVGSAFTESDSFEFEARIVRRSGAEGWVRGRGRVARDESGAPLRMGGTAQEITETVRVARELAAARDAAMDASRLKSEFLATMSHEIRTPLNGVIGLTDLLLRTELQPAQEQFAAGIAQSGRTLLLLVNDILDLSKIEAGKLELEMVDFDVRDVVDQVVSLMVEPAKERLVDLVVTCRAEVPRTVRGDPVRFGQIATNLVSNAVKFTREGQVSIRVGVEHASSGGLLRVEVTDTGIGIPAEIQPLLFESFTQADASTTREYGGTGLGLAISRRLAEALGGGIGFSSEVGVGSTFWFTAAFEDAQRRPSDRPTLVPVRALAAVSTNSRGTVLVAEDNLVNQMVARGMLEGLGYVVEFVQDGREAVAAVSSTPERFVAVLMDCQMPRLDGYAATRAIREQEQPGVRLPIIAMTASVVVGEEARCLEAGMDDFLIKPVNFELLESTLAKWIEGTEAPAPHDHGLIDEFGVLDLDRIAMLRALGPEENPLFAHLVETFTMHLAEEVAAIRSAVHASDAAKLVQSAHLLRGGAGNLGTAAVGVACQALEDAGLQQDLGDSERLLADLESQAVIAVQALRALDPPLTPVL